MTDLTDYRPIDVTPSELQAAGLAAPARWVHDTTTNPEDITDWPARQATAIVPYRLVFGRPVNPCERTGRVGRDLGRWGENPAADPIVVCGTGNTRRILLIQRADCRAWAIPGDMVDPGETAPVALVRELREETGVDLTNVTPQVVARTYVKDRRNTDEAWVATTAALFQPPAEVTAVGADDALDARWWPFAGLAQLDDELRAAGGALYEAHRPLLAAALTVLDG
ncbi:NUDIX domain-containing protein [Micromonospora haikouensis]|uniref:NUDIX domain-containing protein n=1 Tax=Micromonospora haikouensis TaxID=686309 RepID=UPI0034258165